MAKYPAKGTIIKVAASATPTNTLLGVKEIQLTGGERKMIDVSNQASANTEESIPHPLREVRGLEVTLFYDPADTQHERIRAAHEAGTLEYQTLVLPDVGAAQFAFSGYITKFTLPTIGLNGALECTYTFMAIGAETFTA